MKMAFANLELLLLACFLWKFVLDCSGIIYRGRGSVSASAGNVLILYGINFFLERRMQQGRYEIATIYIANAATESRSKENQLSLDQSFDSSPLLSVGGSRVLYLILHFCHIRSKPSAARSCCKH